MTEAQPKSSAEIEIEGLLSKNRYDEKTAKRVKDLIDAVLLEKKPDLPKYRYLDADYGERAIDAVVLGRVPWGRSSQTVFLTPYGIYRSSDSLLSSTSLRSMLWSHRDPAEPAIYFNFAKKALEEIREHPVNKR